MAKTPMEELRSVDGTKGPMFATVIIIIVLLIGGATVFYGQFKKSREWQKAYNNAEITSEQTSKVAPTSTSTDLSTIETDLEVTDLSSLDADIDSLPTTI
ncbi:MAG: hypothetical protein QG665_341 [Patescibacteria group bacterium]|nr:hypothetical protein [Patescibacteria group bacterium]